MDLLCRRNRRNPAPLRARELVRSPVVRTLDSGSRGGLCAWRRYQGGNDASRIRMRRSRRGRAGIGGNLREAVAPPIRGRGVGFGGPGGGWRATAS